jgi:hypothetical protein
MLLPKCVHQPEASAPRPLGLLVMGLQIATVDHKLSPTILGDLAIKLPDNVDTRLLIDTNHGTEVFRGSGAWQAGLGHEGDGQQTPAAGSGGATCGGAGLA